MTTHINKRYSDESLWLLLDDLKFVNALHHIRNGRIPKIGNEIELGILCKLERCVTTIKMCINEKVYLFITGRQVVGTINNN